jgi:hypothetical protein
MPLRWLRHCASVSTERPVIPATSSTRSKRPCRSVGIDFGGTCASLVAVANSVLPLTWLCAVLPHAHLFSGFLEAQTLDVERAVRTFQVDRCRRANASRYFERRLRWDQQVIGSPPRVASKYNVSASLFQPFPHLRNTLQILPNPSRRRMEEHGRSDYFRPV